MITIIVKGDVGVRQCSNRSCEQKLHKNLGELVAVHVIPRPHENVSKILPVLK
jgi:microcompartment protein CcmL/EutN